MSKIWTRLKSTEVTVMPLGNYPGAHSFKDKNEGSITRTRTLVSTRSTSFRVSDLGWSPNTDIFETENALVIRIEIAGVDKDQMEITLRGNSLSVCGRRHDPKRYQRVHFHQAEISYGPFEKVIILPESLKSNKINAKYREGFLEIVVSKQPPDDATSVAAVEIKD